MTKREFQKRKWEFILLAVIVAVNGFVIVDGVIRIIAMKGI